MAEEVMVLTPGANTLSCRLRIPGAKPGPSGCLGTEMSILHPFALAVLAAGVTAPAAVRCSRPASASDSPHYLASALLHLCLTAGAWPRLLPQLNAALRVLRRQGTPFTSQGSPSTSEAPDVAEEGKTLRTGQWYLDRLWLSPAVLHSVRFPLRDLDCLPRCEPGLPGTEPGIPSANPGYPGAERDAEREQEARRGEAREMHEVRPPMVRLGGHLFAHVVTKRRAAVETRQEEEVAGENEEG
eukprot:901036-Prorocentrum_minimum.AAC.2